MSGYRLGDMLSGMSAKEMKRAWWHATNQKKNPVPSPPQAQPKKDNGESSEDPPFSVYLAAPYPCKPDMERIARRLEEAGYRVTARWIGQKYREMHEIPDAEKKDLVMQDRQDIVAGDILVVMSPPLFHHSGTGGRHVELGIALEMGKPVLLVGDRVNLFHWHPLVRQIPMTSVETMIVELKKMIRKQRSRSQEPDVEAFDRAELIWGTEPGRRIKTDNTIHPFEKGEKS